MRISPAAAARIRGEIEVTMTFKQKKVELVAQGFDPALTADAIFFEDARTEAYVPLDSMMYRDIVDGKIRP